MFNKERIEEIRINQERQNKQIQELITENSLLKRIVQEICRHQYGYNYTVEIVRWGQENYKKVCKICGETRFLKKEDYVVEKAKSTIKECEKTLKEIKEKGIK